MKPTIGIFTAIGVFFLIVATVYAFWVRFTEWAGIPAIYALGVFALMVAFYLNLVDKKYNTGPADDADGEIEEYAGTYGTFAPWSWWPLGLGVACAIIVLGVAVGWWVFYIGVGLGLFFVIGWVFEFSRRGYKH